MKRLMVAVFGIVVGLGLAIDSVEAAKRLGGGRSTGIQRDGATQRQATPPAQAPQQNAAAATANRPGMGRWLAPLAGLAAGLGLAYLFGDQLGSLLTGLLVIAAIAVIAMLAFRMLARNRPQPALQGAGGPTSQYRGMGRETVAAPPPSQPLAGAPAAAVASAVPQGFDVEGFLRQAKKSFIELQAANDRGDLDALRDMATDELFAELKRDLEARGSASQHVEVITLNADLLEVVTEGGIHWASVRFSGALREEATAVPTRFEEIWNLQKPASGASGWVLAGIQQVN